MIEQNSKNQEFYEILKMVKQSLKDNKSQRVYDIACMRKLVTKNKEGSSKPFSISKVGLVSRENRSALFHILEITFGKEFYKDREFISMFNDCYNLPLLGIFKTIKKPTNLEETNLMFDTINEVLKVQSFYESSKIVNETMCRFGEALAYFSNQIDKACVQLDKLYDQINDLIVSFNKNDLLLVEDIEKMREMLNLHINMTNPTEETKNVGDYITNFIKEFNASRMPICENERYQDNLLKYYGNIVNTKFNEFNYELLPSYDDSDYISYMDNLEDMLQDNYSKDKQFAKKFVAVTMHHQGYYKR